MHPNIFHCFFIINASLFSSYLFLDCVHLANVFLLYCRGVFFLLGTYFVILHIYTYCVIFLEWVNGGRIVAYCPLGPAGRLLFDDAG